MAKHEIRTIVLPGSNGSSTQICKILGTTQVFNCDIDTEEFEDNARHLVAYLTNSSRTIIYDINDNFISDILSNNTRIALKTEINMDQFKSNENGTYIRFLLNNNNQTFSESIPIYKNINEKFKEKVPAGTVFVLTFYNEYNSQLPAWVIDMGMGVKEEEPSSEEGISLPDVTIADNGKFLQVVNGQWTATTIQQAAGGSF